MGVIGLIAYTLLSAFGLSLIKLGLSKGSVIAFCNDSISISVSWVMIVGLFMYLASFCLSIVVMKKMNLGVFYPLASGLIYFWVCMFSACVIKESLSGKQILGMISILIGILLIGVK